MSEVKRVAREPFDNTSIVGGLKRFKIQYESLFIVNNGSASLTFSTGVYSFLLDPGEIFDEVVDPFDTLTVTATSGYKGFVREEVW